jgi:hypothetical protein
MTDPLAVHAAAHDVPGIAFRRAGIPDVDAIHALIRRAYAHYVPVLGYLPGPMRRDYRAQLAQNPVWLAQSGSNLAALLELIIEPSCIIVEDLAVDPAFQGLRARRMVHGIRGGGRTRQWRSGDAHQHHPEDHAQHRHLPAPPQTRYAKQYDRRHTAGISGEGAGVVQPGMAKARSCHTCHISSGVAVP